MKKITYTKHKRGHGGGFFWQPWGFPGCLWRLIAFLLLLMLIMWLLNMLHGCRNTGVSLGADNVIVDPDVADITKIGQDDPLPKVPVDTIDEWRNDISDPGVNLPAPDRNYLPPVNDDDIVTGDDGRRIVGNRLNIILDSDADDQTFRQWANEFKSLYPDDVYSIVFYDPNTKLLQIQVPSAERDRIMNSLPGQITDISFKIFPEGLLGPTAAAKPNDPIFRFNKLSWYFEPIQAFDAWAVTEGSPEVKIAIVDSYFDLNHDDLNSDRILYPYSVRNRNGNVTPARGCDELSFQHGSIVASLALGNKDNFRGTAGIAPKCSFIPISVSHQCTSMTLLNGILYAIYKGANVINVSWGADFDESISQIPVKDQIEISKNNYLAEQDVWDYVTDLADKRNVTIVWAAGNENIFTGLDPSKRCDSAIRVSALNEKLAKADFSNYGNFKQYDVESSTISAPGVYMFGAAPYNAYGIVGGTSCAAPIVTGAVALMKSLDPTLSNSEIITILQETGKKPSDGCTTIGPVIQIKDALLRVQDNFVRMDDLLKNHNRLIGLWQSTELLTVVVKDIPTGEMARKYFEFRNPGSGRSIIYETGSKCDYTAGVNVSWAKDGFSLETGEYVSSSSPNGYAATAVQCRPDENGLLQCIETSVETGAKSKYYLKKVKSRKQE